MTKIIFSGRIPMPQGAYDATKAYTINNLVAMYGMSFLANGDVAADYAPAQLNQDGTVSLINTDKWTLFAGDPSAYNMKQYFDDTVEQITALIANKANIDGWYSTLTVGAAENLVGHGTTPAVISFRPAGGTRDIGSGAASIAKIKGRTDAWNQGTSNLLHNVDNCTYTTSGDDTTFTRTDANTAADVYLERVPIIAGHKYLFLVEVQANQNIIYEVAEGGQPAFIYDSITPTNFTQYSGIHQAVASTYLAIHFRIGTSNTDGTMKIRRRHRVYDLTLQYGAGHEPATAAAFLSEYPEALTAPYNTGKLISNKMTALVTDGFNQWNERWFNGAINEQGQAYSSASNIAAYNFMPCLPSMNYAYDSHKIVALFWYDANRNFIYRSSNADTGIKVVASPTNAAYFRFYCRSTYGTTYKNDIAINLSHSGIRDGEYEPYWQSTLNIDHSKIYGKLNGAGEMVQVAPNGFRGVGSNCDEVDFVRKEAYIRRAWVDMGTLNWTLVSGAFYAAIPNSANTINRISAKYGVTRSVLASSDFTNLPDKSCATNISSGNWPVGTLLVKDSAYATAAAFKAAMDGVMLDYQLATPLHYTDLMYSEDGGQTFIEIPSNYRVDDFGTERRLPDGIVDGAPASTPLVADVQYAMNAVDTLRRLPTNYLSKESTENLLAALQSAGVIAGYTMTYDEDNAEYDFTIIAPAGA